MRKALIEPVEHGVQQVGQHDQARQRGAQVPLAMAEVVLEAIALGLERVVVLVLDLPARPPGRDDVAHRLGRHGQGAGKGVVIHGLARLVGRGQLAPVDHEGIVCVAQRQCLHPAVAIKVDLAPGTAPYRHLLDLPATLQHVQPFVGRHMRVGLAHQHEVQPLRAQCLAKRFMAVQVVAQHHRAELGPAGPMALQPAPRGIELAVLLGTAVLRRDKLRRQGHDLVLSGLHQYRCDRAVAVQSPARMVALRALRAVQRRGREIRHPVQSQ